MLRNRKRLGDHVGVGVNKNMVVIDTKSARDHQALLPLSHYPKRTQTRAYLLRTIFMAGVCALLVCIYYNARKNYTIPPGVSSAISGFIISQDDYDRLSTSIKNMSSCIITISAWRHYGQVRTLYESMQTNQNQICFIWFVADDPYYPEDHAMNRAMTKIKQDWNDRFPIVTLPVMQDRLGAVFDHYYSIAFASSKEQETTAAMIPFALQFGFDILELESILYLKKDLTLLTHFVPDMQATFSNYVAITSPRNTSNLVINATYQGMFEVDYLLLRQNVSVNRVLASWIDQLHTPLAKQKETHDRSDLISFFHSHLPQNELFLGHDHLYIIDTWDPFKGFSFRSPSIFLDLKALINLDKQTLKRLTKQHSAFHHNNQLVESTKMKDHALIKYLHLWLTHQNPIYTTISYGFDHFLDGTVVEPWMHQLYNTLIQPVLMDSDYIDASEWAVTDVDVYTRIEFQERIQKNPFRASGDSIYRVVHHPVTFIDWLLQCGPLHKVVDMNGLYYFSVIEEVISNKIKYPYPMSSSFFSFSTIFDTQQDHDPMGVNYDEFKDWFTSNVVSQRLLSSKYFYKGVQSSYEYHKANHWSYHQLVSSPSDVGLNVIGWHGGIFGLGIQASKLFSAAHRTGLRANAVPLKPLLLSKTGPKYLNPTLLGYNLTKSCSEAVILIAVNADYTWEAKGVIPEIIWKFKYTIGYFQWELDVFPRNLVDMMNEYDEIWVSTKFVADAIIHSPQYSNKPIKVVPIPLDDRDVNLSKLDDKDITDNSPVFHQVLGNIKDEYFVFLVVFDFWSMEERKNPDAAIRAFVDAFPLESQVEDRYRLIVKSQNGSSEQLEKLLSVSKDYRIIFLSDMMSANELRILQSRTDCYISLHRSEGYGMNILEEMGRGIPVIATNYSGNVDFFESVVDFVGTCIFPIPYKLVEMTENLGLYEKGNHWAEPDHHFAVKAMRSVVKHDCKQKFGDAISAHIVDHFGIDAVGRKMKIALSESYDRIRKKQLLFLENRRQMTSW